MKSTEIEINTWEEIPAAIEAKDAERLSILLDHEEYGEGAKISLGNYIEIYTKRGKVDNVKFLIAFVECHNILGALAIAQKCNHQELIGTLVEAASAKDILPKEAAKVLSRAIYTNQVEVALKALNFIDNLNGLNEGGESFLHMAVRKDNTELAKQLIERGANVNIADREGNTALHIAASTQHDSTALLLQLMAAKADHTMQNQQGQTPIKLAENNKVNHSFLNNLEWLIEKDKAEAEKISSNGSDVVGGTDIQSVDSTGVLEENLSSLKIIGEGAGASD